MIESGNKAYPLRGQLRKAEKVSGLTPALRLSRLSACQSQVSHLYKDEIRQMLKRLPHGKTNVLIK